MALFDRSGLPARSFSADSQQACRPLCGSLFSRVAAAGCSQGREPLDPGDAATVGSPSGATGSTFCLIGPGKHPRRTSSQTTRFPPRGALLPVAPAGARRWIAVRRSRGSRPWLQPFVPTGLLAAAPNHNSMVTCSCFPTAHRHAYCLRPPRLGPTRRDAKRGREDWMSAIPVPIVNVPRGLVKRAAPRAGELAADQVSEHVVRT